MPRLTVPPNFIGTSGIDTLVAQESNASVAIGIDILNPGVISTFSGNDSITGTGTVNLKQASISNFKTTKAGNGIGISNNGSLNAGSGDDTITGSGIGGSFGNRNTGNGIGISNSGSFDAGSGDDTIIGTGIGGKLNSRNGGNGIGISNSGSLNAGSGGDTITGNGTGGTTATGIGISNSGSFDAGDGNDTITGTGTGGTAVTIIQGNNALEEGKGGTGTGIRNSGSFDIGDGNDTITGTGTGGGLNLIANFIVLRGPGTGTPGSNGIGISNSATLNAGRGGDTITGIGTGESGGGSGKGGTGIGISNSGSFDAGDGNDTITGTGTGGNGGAGALIGTGSAGPFINFIDFTPPVIRGESGDGGAGIGITNSNKLNTGKGEDTFIGTGNAGSNNKTGRKSSTGGTTIGIQNIKEAIITTGENNDTIKGSANGLEANTLAYGIFNDGIIDTGSDHDILTGEATTTIGGTAYGIYGQGIIRTGDGNDKIIATSNIDKVQQKVTIGGGIRFELGTGNDYFKGFGSAIVDGGNGFDTLDVRAFKRSEVSISGVISSNNLNPANITFNNNGNLITLSTTGFENFIFADTSFSYSSLT